MSAEDLRETVRARYAVAATTSDCCGPEDGFGAALYDAAEREELPVEAVTVMTPDGGGTPEVWGVYQQMLRPGLALRQLDRFGFYAACREPDVAVCVATGDAALYSNVLLTIGYLTPDGEDGPPAP